MRRLMFPSAALAAALAVLLTGCAGETPTSPTGGGGGGNGGNGGSCTVAIAMVPSATNPVSGSEIVVRSAVTRSGASVPDGTSVQISTDLGFFAENGLQTISKTTTNGAADVTLFSASAGLAHIRAVYDCASATVTVTYQGVPNSGPYVSSYSPQSGSCAGGETVTILGGKFGDTAGTVLFGGKPGSVATWTASRITVLTPFRQLKDPTKPEDVDLVVQPATGGASSPVKFRYFCIDPAQKMTVASMNPVAGSPGGGDSVTILGSHFGTTMLGAQVTFCGLPGQIVSLQDTQIVVSTPAHALANPALSESCAVVVTRDLGLATEQNATVPVPFVYKGSGGSGACNTDPNFYVSSLSPNTGSPDGGTVVTITGNGFPANAALLKVDFGGIPATVVGQPTGTVFQVSTPRRILAQADVPETVDVVVTDLGSASQRCYRVLAGFVYTVKALDPSIYSISPRTGPNDQATRVTIFGTNFQFPMQVFLTGAACGAQRVEAAVLSVTPSQIVFNTPVAVGGNTCLAAQLVNVTILNPSTGKTASYADAFKYYSCPVSGIATPSVGSMTAATTVVISGSNFQEPVLAAFRTGGSTPIASIQVQSVSNTSVIVTMPPLQTLLGGSLSCRNVDGFIDLTFPALTCQPSPLAVPFSYHADPPTLTAASPTNLNQDGTPSPGPTGGTPATITVLGGSFAAPMTVTLVKDGVPVPNTPINNANVSSPSSLTFFAPAVPNNSLNQQNCLSGGTVSGLKYVPTSFGIRVTNTATGCSSDLPNVLVYNPTDLTCRAGLTILPASLPAGTAGVAYGPVTFTASGGAGPPYTWAIASGAVPGGMTLNPGTGVFSGTPAAAGTYTFTVQVTDAGASTNARVYTLLIN